jgi:hypothetical protein
VILIGSFIDAYGPLLCVAFLVTCAVAGYIRDRRRPLRRRSLR